LAINIALLDFCQSNANTPWLLPLSVTRVATNTNGIDVGIEQFNSIIPEFGEDLPVSVGDTAYNNPRFIHGIQQHKNLIHIARLQSNRIIYHTPKSKRQKVTLLRERGHELMKLLSRKIQVAGLSRLAIGLELIRSI